MIYQLVPPCPSIHLTNCLFPEALAVIQGNNPGWVFGDDPDKPRSMLVWAQGIEGFYLVGDADNTAFLDEIDGFIDPVLKPRLKNSGISWFEISGTEKWNPLIEHVFENRNLERSQQWVYTLKPTGVEPTRQIASIGDRKPLRIAQPVLSDSLVVNKEFLFSKMLKFWGSVDAFLRAGIGYMLISGDEIASLCFSGFVVGNVHVIDIETKGSFRRRGFAELVARAFIQECADRRLQIHWDCMAENVASVRLAEKLGLMRSHTYTLYSFPL